MKQVVSNTTPISNLLRIQQLPLLRLLFERVLIPGQVAAELTRGRHLLGEWQRAHGAEVLTVIELKMTPFLRQLEARLDSGEAAAIALANDRSADLLLMDEVEGRQVAVYHGQHVAGTLGILLEAKRLGHLNAVKRLVEQLEQINFRISPALKQHVLELAGEVAP
jgi:predicted nucleic acid-binding protein